MGCLRGCANRLHKCDRIVVIGWNFGGGEVFLGNLFTLVRPNLCFLSLSQNLEGLYKIGIT